MLASWLCALTLSVGPIEVTLTTSEGETVEGTVKVSSIKLDTEFGSAEVAAEKLASIEFGEPDVVLTTGGLELRGEVSLARLRIQTESGARTLKRSELQSLVVWIGGERPGGGGFEGAWMMSYGPLVLERKGARFVGTYGHAGEAKVEGVLNGERFEFEWRRAGSSGSGWFELWEGGEVMMGEFRSPSGTEAVGAYRRAHRPPQPRPGEIVPGQAECGLNYHLFAPEGWDGKAELPAIVFFHGSNMSSRPYVETFVSQWPELARDYFIAGVDGELIGTGSKPDNRFYNFSYINFSGHEVGEPWRYRQSPGLVADLLEELREALPVGRVFAGGHSQGGFLTYAVLMFYPELVDGVFPMSCNLLVQCEPGHFDDERARAAQRDVPIAHVHGTTDPQVDYTSAVYCYEAMQDGGFPALRLFDHPTAGHMFALLPVEEAVRWLGGMTSDDPAALVDFAKEAFAAGEVRDALAALQRAEGLEGAAAVKDRARTLERKIDAQAETQAKRLERAMSRDVDGAWVDDFWEFRRQYALAGAAEKCMALYAKLRAEHAEPADELFYAARNESDERRRRELREEIVEKYYASKWYKLVRRWLE